MTPETRSRRTGDRDADQEGDGVKGKPTRYDSEKRLVHYEDGPATGAATESFFIEQAVKEFRRYGKPEWLLWAIEQGLPGLMQSAKARAVMARVVAGNLRKRGERPAVNLKSDIRKQEIFARVWFHHGRGYAIFHSSASEATTTTACELAADELGCTPGYAHNVWKDAGGREPEQPHYKMMATLFFMDGKQSLNK